MGMTALTNVVPKTDRAFCENALKKLAEMNSRKVSLEQANAHEQQWDRQQGLQIKTRNEDVFSGQSRRIKKGFEKQIQELVLQSQQLSVILAARLFEIEKGAKSFSDLVPKYLKTVPINQNTKEEIPFSLRLPKYSNELLF